MPNSSPFLLIIGYGNSLRRDDGAGLVLAERLAKRWQAQGYAVRLLLSHQLAPEMALDLAEEDVAGALFVDASVELRTKVSLLPVEAEQSTSASGQTSGLNHHVGASMLLTYAGQLYGHRPAAWLLPVPAVDLDHGEGLSPTTTAFVDEVLAQAEKIWSQIEDGMGDV